MGKLKSSGTTLRDPHADLKLSLIRFIGDEYGSVVRESNGIA